MAAIGTSVFFNMSQDDNLIVYLTDLKRNQQFVVNQMDEDEMPTIVHDNRIRIRYCTRTELILGKNPAIHRTIKNKYHLKRPVIRKNLYNAPQELIDLIASENKSPRSVILDTLDRRIPSVDVDYTKHFHELFYLEEISLRKEIKDKYNQIEAYFSDIETVHENGKVIKRKYAIGIYDLEVRDLFETRPSLQIGDKIFARKHSSLTVCYEGVLIEIKDSDLICIQFKDEFVKTFDNTAYVVEFDFARNLWIRMHFALDSAWDTFGIEYLIPKQLTKRKVALIDLKLNEDNRLETTNGKVLNWFNDGLNFHQKQAVVNVLRAEFLNPYLIHGPPGTGKTTTLTEIILQILTNIENSSILITTQSNSAADLIVQRLIKFDQVNCNNLLRIVSIKHFQKKGVLPDDIKDYTYTVDDLLPDSESNVYVRLSSAKRFRVVVGTSTKIAHMLECRELRNHFTHAIIDEAGQSHELGVLVPMALVGSEGQTIMAGDPMQMPPIVINKHANDRGLNISMLSRLLGCYSNIERFSDGNQKPYISHLVSKLIQNYRSLPSILEFYNTQFYNSELIPMIDAKNSHEAKLLNHISQSSIFNRPNENGIYFINVNGQNIKRKNSYCNPEEICVIQHLVHKLKTIGFSDEAMGIITPYSLQQRQIEIKLKEIKLKIGTVEDFQGLERNVILISTVRTCPGSMKIDISRFLGFVKCPKRINVAISRARALVLVVGVEDLLSTDEHWNALIQKCKLNGTFGNAMVEKCKANKNFFVRKIELF